MHYRGGMKPSRGASAFAVVVGIGMACFGLFMLSQISGPSRHSDFPSMPGYPTAPSAPGADAGVAFVILWLLVLGGIIFFHLRNALSDDAPPTETFEMKTDY